MSNPAEKYICPSKGDFCKTCPPYNMNTASVKAWENRFSQSGGMAPVDYQNGDMMDGYSYCGKQSVKVVGGGKKGGANNKNKNLGNKHSNNKMNAKPNVPMRRGGPRRQHRPIDNTQQMKILEEFKAGKIKEDKALAALEELNLPEKKLPLKENIPILKKAMGEAKSGDRELGQVENFIRRIMRKREKWVPRENGNGAAKNNKKNNKKNNNATQEGGVKRRRRSSAKKSRKASKKSRKASKKSRKSSKKSRKSKKSKKSRKSSKGGAKRRHRSASKKSKKSHKSSKKSKKSKKSRKSPKKHH